MAPTELKEPIPEGHQIGAVLAALGAFLLFRRALTLPPGGAHAIDRPIYVLLACVLVTYAWGVFMAMLARSRDWTPQTCGKSGYPILVLGAIAHAAAPQAKAILDIGGLFVLSDLAGRLCRRLAYPALGWWGKDPRHPPLRAKDGSPSRALGNEPIG